MKTMMVAGYVALLCAGPAYAQQAPLTDAQQDEMSGEAPDNPPPEDLKIFFDGGWADNAAFVSRIKEKIQATDFPDDDSDLSDAMAIMDSMVVLVAAQGEWIRTMKK